MMTRFTFERFKSYRQAMLPLTEVTLLVGANASGKSNAIEGMRLLAWMARGRRLNEILQTVQAEELALRGTLTDWPYRLGKSQGNMLTLGCSLHDDALEGWTDLAITLSIDVHGLRLRDERITSPAERVALYRTESSDHRFTQELQVAYNNFMRGGKKPRIACHNQQAIFTQLTSPARFGAEHPKAQQLIPRVTHIFQSQLEQIVFLNPDPSRMRGYSFIVDTALQGNGANLSSVLYALCTEQEQQDQVLSFIRALPEREITGIEFLKGPRNEVMFRLTETFAGQRDQRDAPVLSDGTLRVLAVAATLLAAPAGSLVVIEEIDNGVHPSRARMLMEQIQQTARARQVRVLLTTHNPALLDALPLDALPDVVCCYRDPQEGDSRLIRLEDLPSYPELVAQGTLGNLMTRGILERFVTTRQSPEEKAVAALSWLDTLESQLGQEE